MPPAFNLSQDQTLEFNLCFFSLFSPELKEKLVVFLSALKSANFVSFLSPLTGSHLPMFTLIGSLNSNFLRSALRSEEKKHSIEAFSDCQESMEIFFSAT